MISAAITGLTYQPVKLDTFNPENLSDAYYIVENQSEFSSEEIDEAQNTIALADFWK